MSEQSKGFGDAWREARANAEKNIATRFERHFTESQIREVLRKEMNYYGSKDFNTKQAISQIAGSLGITLEPENL